MIRIEQPDGWILIRHQDHARLAGAFARHWGNADFAAPEPRSEILVAVDRHDDAWAERDARPGLTPAGRPGAFSRELVARYAAFEEIDLADYLRVRAAATETVAAANPHAAVIISMHTVNLLAEQADAGSMSGDQREAVTRFLEQQHRRQQELVARVRRDPARADEVAPERLRRAFEFLQACDSLSLIACVDLPEPMPLRHAHPRRDGTRVTFTCVPAGGGCFTLSPWPFDFDEREFFVPCRRVRPVVFPNEQVLQEAYARARVETRGIRLVASPHPAGAGRTA